MPPIEEEETADLVQSNIEAVIARSRPINAATPAKAGIFDITISHEDMETWTEKLQWSKHGKKVIRTNKGISIQCLEYLRRRIG